MRHRLIPPSWVVVAVPLYAAVLVLVRGRPSTSRDAGIFLSVAARLGDGDRLYADVWDNKPPFFYFVDAIALDIAGWRGPFLMDAVWLSVASVAMWMLLAAAETSRSTRIVGTLIYPLLLTGAWYTAGYSELPLLALAPAVGWLLLRSKAAAAGILLGVGAFFRPDYGVVFVALILAALSARTTDFSTRRINAVRLLAAFFATATAAVAVLVARGELTAYLTTMRTNVGYPNRALTYIGEQPGLVGHVMVVARLIGGNRPRGFLFALVVLVLALVLIAALRERSQRRTGFDGTNPTRTLAIFLIYTAAATAVTLALTALWWHHLELMALPATLGTCLLVSRIDASVESRIRRIGGILAISAICLVAFGGVVVEGEFPAGLRLAPSPSPGSSGRLSDWWRKPRSPSAFALNAEAAKVRDPRAVITYARLGDNHDDAHAAFIENRLKLACPLFHQYPFSSNLDQVVRCIETRRPQLLLVGPGFVVLRRSTTQRWDQFVTDSRRLLRAQYVEALRVPANSGMVEVWSLRVRSTVTGGRSG